MLASDQWPACRLGRANEGARVSWAGAAPNAGAASAAANVSDIMMHRNMVVRAPVETVMIMLMHGCSSDITL